MMAASDGEGLGLQAYGNERPCLKHSFCGMAVAPNDIIRFKTIVIDGVNQYKGNNGIPVLEY
jgi:hypothetical protein